MIKRRSTLGKAWHATRKLALSLSPCPSQVPPSTPDTTWTLQGSELVLEASSLHGAAVFALVCNGLDYVNATDLGREIQTAYQINGQGEANNPTEAGSSGSVPSKVVGASATGKTFVSTVNPSFWNPVSGQIYSADQISKSITVDYNGVTNLIRHDVTVATTQDYQSAIFEGLTGYVDGSLTDVYTFDGTTLSPLAVPSPSAAAGTHSDLPLIMATPDGSHAIGIYSSQPSYLVFINVVGSGVGKWDAAWHPVIPCPKGSYSWSVFYCVGTLDTVKATMAQLIAQA